MSRQSENKITILGEEIAISSDLVDINKLKFLAENPRVFSCTYGKPRFRDLGEDEKQELMYEQLLKENSVRRLIPDVKRHGGLVDPILVRWDTKEVIEGNSRLAVYRKLYEESRDEKWRYINCQVISTLSQEQLHAYLNEIHVKGKTAWTAYERANFVYVRRESGLSIDDIATMFGETKKEIEKRIKIIDMMKKNRDTDQSHFSYYDVLVRSTVISEKLSEDKDFKEAILDDIKHLDPKDNETYFSAQSMRTKLPVIIDKPKALKKYKDGELLNDVYRRVKPSNAQKNIREAKNMLTDIEKRELANIKQSDLGAMKQDLKKISREVNRLDGILSKE